MIQQSLNLGTTAGDGTGGGLRDTFIITEANITNLFKVKGWGFYVDSLATPSISIDTTFTEITIDDLGASIKNFLPREIRGSGELFSANKITPISDGDTYGGRLDIRVDSKSGSPTLIEIIIDISGGAAGTNKVFTGYIQTGGTIPYDQSILFDFFSRTTFLANGGKIYARTDSGSVTITNRNLFIERKYKGDI